MSHDNSYKLLFSHPEMMVDLLKGFVNEAWVNQCDFTSLEKVSGSYVSDDLRDREDDLIWRVRWGDEWIYVYLLLEFQSTVDHFMAVRILGYLGLLYQDIIRTGELKPQDKLPPVLPVVLYNGARPWQAPVNLDPLIHPAPAGLENYRPHISYLLLDEGRYEENYLGSLKNLVAALFQLENSRTDKDIQTVIVRLIDWLKHPEQSGIRRAFTVWINRVLLPRKAPGSQFKEFSDLNEVNTMLAETVEQWTKDWKQQGLEQGIHLGESAVLKRLLIRRFKVIPPEMLDRIEQAMPEQVEQWLENILEATTIEDVFKAH
jgi:predicted transposase/invertase (TIGR01784 family)